MGEVYRATDTNLKRSVAIKVLPTLVAADADRLARFQREAEVLAALNHPNIGAIYGLEKTPDLTALVMELVEGEDLSQRIARGAIPIAEALPIARQMGEALEAAHEQGIIHRDLKPANIKVRADGTVKVLDFGLAKAMDPAAASSPGISMSPTLSIHATQAGIILGTAAYMSPEQARGRTVDKRTDVWAFGCVLFEMLTGARAFDGEDVADTIGAVIHKEPAWTKLPAATSATVRLVLQRCLEKDPSNRMRDIADVRLALDGAFDAVAPASVVAAPAPRSGNMRSLILGAMAGAALAASIAAAAWWLPRAGPTRLSPVRFSIVPLSTQPLNLQGFFRQIAISPDGTQIAYVAGSDGQLMIRALDQLDAVPVRGMTGAGFPFFSPDGRWVGVFMSSSRQLAKVSINGGPAEILCRYQGTPRGAVWGSDETIIFATNDANTGLLSVPAAGGEPKTLTTPDPAHGEQDHYMPSLAPDGHTVFFTIWNAAGVENARVAALDLRSGRRTTLVRGGSDATYVAAASGQPGYLVYGSAGSLRAVRFDLARLSVVSDPVPVVDEVATMATGATDYSVSRQGTLVYVPGHFSARSNRSLAWVSRDGRQDALGLPPRPYNFARLSPDETRIALAVSDQDNDIWIYEIARGVLTRLTSDPNLDGTPVWSPDGQHIFFVSNRSGSMNVHSQPATGTGTADRLITTAGQQALGSFSPDGRSLVFQESGGATTDLMVLRFDPRPHAEPLLRTPFNEASPDVSPDGKWLAYYSNESGGGEVYVRPFPKVDGGRWQISTAGGSRPAWSKDGKELFYLDSTAAMMAVPVQAGDTFTAGNPVKLFDGPWYSQQPTRPYDITRDGRFLMIKSPRSEDLRQVSPTMTVVVNWTEELKTRVPTK